MKRVAALLVAAAVPLCGSIVDLTQADSVVLRSGDKLSFELVTTSYTTNAQAFGLPSTPSAVNIALVALPQTTTGTFSVTLSSPDASIELALDGPLGLTAGYLSCAGFQGAVSTLQGHLNLTPTSSQQLFAAGTVRLELLYQGADLTLGLPSLTLGQTLFTTLSGGPLSVGAYTRSITLDRPDAIALTGPFHLNDMPVPEAGSSWLLAGGGVLLCAFSKVLKRSQARRY